jgi:hypothetical protein
MTRPIFLIGGGKGGVGKSLLSMTIVDFLSRTERTPFLVETDTSVPDVYKTYQAETGGELVNLDEREGWIELVNLVEGKPESTFVINTGARNQTGISNFGKTLSKALPQLNRKLVVFYHARRTARVRAREGGRSGRCREVFGAWNASAGGMVHRAVGARKAARTLAVARERHEYQWRKPMSRAEEAVDEDAPTDVWLTDLDEGEMERRKTAQQERRQRREQEELQELERKTEREQKNFETMMAGINAALSGADKR